MAGLPEDGTGRNPDPADVHGSELASGGGGDANQELEDMECPICLQQCVHPVELPCHHVFCFLCIKGVAMQGPNSKCAICRAQIPYTVLTNPQLKDVSQLYKEPKLANGYQWYYESRGGGWWQYDERTMNDLEREYTSNKPSCQLLLAGHLYIVDFTQMIQYRSNNRNVSRRIRREVNLEKRGVAGIRITGHSTGAGTSGGANNTSPPPGQQGSGVTTRRRRGNPPASIAPQPPPSASSNNHASALFSNNPLPSSARPPNVSNPSANIGGPPSVNEVVISDSDDDSIDEDEDYDSDYSDVDDDMELGEEEEALIGDDSDERETEDEEDYEARDGARAPTRRSDRSNSSNNQTPPPPSGAGVANGSSSRTYSPNSNGRVSRSARSGRSSGGGRSSNGTNGASSRSGAAGLSEPLSPVLAPQASASSNVLFLNHRYNQDDFTINNISNNNIYLPPLDDQIIGQVLAGSSITNSNTAGTVKITFERNTQRGREEFL